MEVGQGPNWGCSAKGKKYVIKLSNKAMKTISLEFLDL
jgi:hypothetical protein